MEPEQQHDGTATLLIVEDEPMLRLVVVETLRDAGYAVLEAMDGDAGLAAIRSDAKIDALITDIKMPGINGYQLAEAALDLRPDLRILLMTGYTSEPLPQKLARRNIRVVYKPFDVDELASVAARLVASPAT
jgi:CheY-like chemotaxis protein